MSRWRVRVSRRLVVFLNNDNYLWSLVCGDGTANRWVRTGRRAAGDDETLASSPLRPGPVRCGSRLAAKTTPSGSARATKIGGTSQWPMAAS
jgi:hypothetical protein